MFEKIDPQHLQLLQVLSAVLPPFAASKGCDRYKLVFEVVDGGVSFHHIGQAPGQNENILDADGKGEDAQALMRSIGAMEHLISSIYYLNTLKASNKANKEALQDAYDRAKQAVLAIPQEQMQQENADWMNMLVPNPFGNPKA